MRDNLCGIYCIENIKNNKKYIGYSNNIYRRFYEHQSNLIKNKHSNSHLQKVFNKHGKDIFNYYVIELCQENKLKEREVFYISENRTFDKEYGYNMTTGGDGLMGIIRTWGDKISKSKLGATFSKEHINNLSKSHMGYVPTESQIEKLRLGNVGKKKCKNTSSSYVGVSKINDSNWRAYIVVDHKQTNLGRHVSELLAAKAYDDKCWELYGDITKLNFPDDYL